MKVPYILIPIHPGRNLAIVLEVAARNFRLKQMGYNAAQELRTAIWSAPCARNRKKARNDQWFTSAST